MLLAVRIPYKACSVETDPCPDSVRELDSEAVSIWSLVLANHIFIIATKIMNMRSDSEGRKSRYMWNKLAIMLTLFIQLYTINKVCGHWVFKNLGDDHES